MKLKKTNITPKARVKANGFIEGLLKYETILTAQIFLQIFQHTTPLSLYLQTSGMDLLSAHRMVITTQENLAKLSRGFDGVKNAADIFVEWANKTLKNKGEDIHHKFDLEETLPQKRLRKKKIMPGEICEDEMPQETEKAYEVEVHNIIMDTVSESLSNRFSKNGQLYSDLSLLGQGHLKAFTAL